MLFLASPLTFDPSVVDIFLALSSGAQLLIVPALMKRRPGGLAQLLFRDHRVTVLQAGFSRWRFQLDAETGLVVERSLSPQVTPSLLQSFSRRVLQRDVLSSGSPLRVLALGGEACPAAALLRSWRHEDNQTCIYNIYGITEVSCWASAYRIPESQLQRPQLSSCCSTPSSVPLGQPLMDTVLEVRDERGRLVTEGEGQLFVGQYQPRPEQALFRVQPELQGSEVGVDRVRCGWRAGSDRPFTELWTNTSPV